MGNLQQEISTRTWTVAWGKVFENLHRMFHLHRAYLCLFPSCQLQNARRWRAGEAAPFCKICENLILSISLVALHPLFALAPSVDQQLAASLY
jgi:hypothetical protein